MQCISIIGKINRKFRFVADVPDAVVVTGEGAVLLITGLRISTLPRLPTDFNPKNPIWGVNFSYKKYYKKEVQLKKRIFKQGMLDMLECLEKSNPKEYLDIFAAKNS